MKSKICEMIELNKISDKQFNILCSKRKQMMKSEEKGNPSLEKSDKKKVINDYKKRLLAEFTHGFYKK